MPYDIYKIKGKYKVCKPGKKKCFSKKGLSKEKARAQQKALYAAEQTNESIGDIDMSITGNLQFVSLDTKSLDDTKVKYASREDNQIIVTLYYTFNDDFEYDHYTITDLNDPYKKELAPEDLAKKGADMEEIETEGDPLHQLSIELLKRYNLTPDDIENTKESAYERIHKYYSESKASKDKEEGIYRESLEFEKLFARIFANEEKP